MNLKNEQILQSGVVFTKEIQITLDDDFNVQDTKPDIEAIVREWGNVSIDSVSEKDLSVQIKGNLDFAAAYAGKGVSSGALVKMTGGIPFDEDINLPDNSRSGNINCTARIDDLAIKAVNSRKISVKAIVTLIITCCREEWIELGCELETEQEENIAVKRKKISYTQMCVDMRDNLRIRQSISLPSGLPNIGEILWEELTLRSLNSVMTDEGLMISGELAAFIIYMSDADNPKVQWYEGSAAFEEKLDLSGSSQDMVCFVKYSLLSCSVEPKANYDGEMRDIALEMVTALDVKGYQDKERFIIEDVYAPCGEVSVETQDIVLKRLVMRNNSRCKVSSQIDVKDNNMIQIISCTAKAHIDSIDEDDGGMTAEGVMVVDIMYVTSLDSSPIRSVSEAIPFSHKLTGADTGAGADMETVVLVDSVGAVMTGNGEIQVNARITIDVIEFADSSLKAVTGCESAEYNQEEFLKAPCIVGFIANGNDNLWTIAKQNHTTVELIRQENRNLPEHCDEDYVVPAREKLLLIKSK